MFIARRILRNSNHLTNYICTSSILKCEEPKDKDPGVRVKSQKKKKEEVKLKEEKVKEVKLKEGKLKEVKLKEEKLNEEDEFDILEHLKPVKKERLRKLRKADLFHEAFTVSVDNVAKDLGGDEKKTKSDLMDYLMSMNISTEPEEDADIKILQQSKGISGQKFEKAGMSWGGDRFERREVRSRAVISFSESLMKEEDKVKLKIWDDLKAEDLAAKTKLAPRNYFDELITWTNEGKLWRFPIDNDQGMDEEAATSFTEHIFLDKHLEPWCPKKGPLRKFMQMVLIGLSKNPYLSLKEKKAHIMWFRDYFEEKKKLLQELGAVGPTKLDVPTEEKKS